MGRDRSPGDPHRRGPQRAADRQAAEGRQGHSLRLGLLRFLDPKSYFHRYATLSDEEAIATATAIWTRINLVNLHENIRPTRQRADLILTKGESHLVEEVALRRL